MSSNYPYYRPSWKESTWSPPELMSIAKYLVATRTRKWKTKEADSRSQDLKDVDRCFFELKQRCLGFESLLDVFYKPSLPQRQSIAGKLDATNIEAKYPGLTLPGAFANVRVSEMFSEMENYCSGTAVKFQVLQMKCESYIRKHRGDEPEPEPNRRDLDLSAISPDLVGARILYAPLPSANDWRRLASLSNKPRVAACMILKDDASRMANYLGTHVVSELRNWRIKSTCPTIPDYSNRVKTYRSGGD